MVETGEEPLDGIVRIGHDHCSFLRGDSPCTCPLHSGSRRTISSVNPRRALYSRDDTFAVLISKITAISATSSSSQARINNNSRSASANAASADHRMCSDGPDGSYESGTEAVVASR